jgi:HrpA-like RNA helicase
MQQLLGVEGMLNGSAGGMELDLQDENLFRILKLHSELPEELRKLPLEVPGGCRRILLSTDISEASLTIPDVEYVVDAGRVNQLMFDQRSLSNRMALCWISRSSSSQRAGRAGRVKNGQYFFLGTQQRFDSLRVTNVPGILRTDLHDVCLRAKHLDSESSISEFLKGALEAPEDDKVGLAIQNLKRLSALSNNEGITLLGGLLVKLPLPPALGKLIVMGIIFRCLDPLLILAAIGIEGGLFIRPKTEAQQTAFRNHRHAFANGSSSDQISTINAFKAIRKEWREKGPSAAADFAYTNLLYFNDYRDASLEANQILRQLSRMGVDFSQTTVDRKNHQFGGLEFNTNSDNPLLIRTLLLLCLSPRIAYPKTYKNDMPLQYHTHTEGNKTMVLGFSPSCDGNRSSSVVVYGKKVQFTPSKMVISELSLVSPLAACLFAGTAKKSDTSTSIHVDDFLRVNFDSKDASVSEHTAVSRLRELRGRFFGVSLDLLCFSVSLLILCSNTGLAHLLLASHAYKPLA